MKVTFSSCGWLLRLASAFAHLCVAFSSFRVLLALAGSFAHLFDSSNAVLGMAFTPPYLEKVIAFCIAETNLVLHNCIPYKTKQRKSS